MTPNGHLKVGVACIRTGYRVSGCQFLKIVVIMAAHYAIVMSFRVAN